MKLLNMSCCFSFVFKPNFFNKQYKSKVTILIYLLLIVLSCNNYKKETLNIKSNEIVEMCSGTVWTNVQSGISIRSKLHFIDNGFNVTIMNELDEGNSFYKKIKLSISGTLVLGNYSTISGLAEGKFDNVRLTKEPVTGYIRIDKENGYISLFINKINAKIRI